MRFQYLILAVFFAINCISLPLVQAETVSARATISADDLRPGIPQPYIVKKGDNLWNIANYFFKNPEKWLKLWEQNLYITNPDLIYPGNKIWFNVNHQGQGGLSKIRPRPEIVVKPVERLEGKVDTSILITALARQDFIQPGKVEGVGHILDAESGRINFGVNDRLYVKFDRPVKTGELFDVFRTTDTVRNPQDGNAVGVLVKHLGQIRVVSKADGLHRAMVLKAFEEMVRGDRLKPAKPLIQHIVPTHSEVSLSGKVMYIRDGVAEAGQNQVIGITLGLQHGLRAGTILTVSRAGRMVTDQLDEKEVRLPSETIAKILVLAPQQHASIALVTKSTGPINIGDSVHTTVAQ